MSSWTRAGVHIGSGFRLNFWGGLPVAKLRESPVVAPSASVPRIGTPCAPPSQSPSVLLLSSLSTAEPGVREAVLPDPRPGAAPQCSGLHRAFLRGLIFLLSCKVYTALQRGTLALHWQLCVRQEAVNLCWA